MSDQHHSPTNLVGNYSDNLIHYLRSREDVFGRFLAIILTVLGSIGYTLVMSHKYVWMAVVASNLVLLFGTKYLYTLSYNHRYLQLCLSKIELMTGMVTYMPNRWNLIKRTYLGNSLREDRFMPEIFADFLIAIRLSSAIITLLGLTSFWYWGMPTTNVRVHIETVWPHFPVGWYLALPLLLMVVSYGMIVYLPSLFSEKTFGKYTENLSALMDEMRKEGVI